MLPLIPEGCLVVVGMDAEAALLPHGTHVVRSGGSAAQLQALLVQIETISSVLSFGIAGGLTPGLATGHLIVADDIVAEVGTWIADAPWTAAIARSTGAQPGRIAGSAGIVGSAAAKAELRHRSGAAAVDMESAVAADFALRRRLPFAALRAVADPAEDALVPSAACGLHPDGSAAPGRVLASLLRRPQDLPGLVRIAWQSGRALRALRLAVRRAAA